MRGYSPLILVLLVLISNVYSYQKSFIHSKSGKRVHYASSPKNVIGEIVNNRIRHYENIVNLVTPSKIHSLISSLINYFIHLILILEEKIFNNTKNKIKNSILYLGLFVLSISRVVSPSGRHFLISLITHFAYSIVFSGYCVNISSDIVNNCK
jgi:hypothetical protein